MSEATPSGNPNARTMLYLAAAAVLGALSGIFWESIVKLPTFVINEHLQAVPNPERELASWFGTDAWFAGIGVVIGLALGVWAWFWFGRRGWVVIVMALLGAIGAALLCWAVGIWLAPESFDIRLARAQVGDRVPISFELRAWPAFFLWAFAAITPVMVLAAFSSDADDEIPAEAPTMTE